MSRSHSLRDELFAQKRFRRALVLLITLSVFGGLIIVPIEQGVMFSDFEDGLWWAATTVSGVGYGDLVPVTTAGRTIGVLLQFAGVGMLGILLGIISNRLGHRQDEVFWKREFDRFHELDIRLGKIEKQLQYLVKRESHEELNEDEMKQS